MMFDWQPYGPPCTTYAEQAIVMECESGALYGSPLDMAHGWRIAANVQMTPAADSRGWCGLALNADITADNRYAEVAIERGIAPYWADDRAYGVQLSTPANHCCDRLLDADDGWHHLSIVYQAGRAEYQIDNARASVAIDMGGRASPELLAVAVDPGESKPGAKATCEWRNVEIHELWNVALPLVVLPSSSS